MKSTAPRRSPLAALLSLLLALLTTAPLVAQSDEGLEEFDEIDPWTEDDPEAIKALGYTRFGPFIWHGADRTIEVQQKLGGTPMLFVETEHFRIGSSLTSYTIPADKPEQKRIEGELKRLKKKLRAFDPRVRKLDPWLRLHLYAQRAEEFYARFHEEFGIEPAAYEDLGPHLGYPNKHLILLCERSSEFVRYLNVYQQAQGSHSYRWGWQNDCLLFMTDAEAMEKSWEDVDAELPFDTMLYNRLATGMAQMFMDGLRQNMFSTPIWIGHALSHRWTREIDPRFPYLFGRTRGRNFEGDNHEWDDRLSGLIKNDFYASVEDMFGWHTYDQMNERDHMVVWSRLEFLLEEADGDFGQFVLDISVPLFETEPDKRGAAFLERQTKALADNFGMTPDEFVQRWAKWGKRRHR